MMYFVYIIYNVYLYNSTSVLSSSPKLQAYNSYLVGGFTLGDLLDKPPLLPPPVRAFTFCRA